MVARVALSLAVGSARVRTEIVSADSFPELAREYGVTSVPTTLVNERRRIRGAPAESALVRQITETDD